jgi:hypothetical protein
MNNQPVNLELLAFFKALADASRLKIVGLLAQEDFTVEQLADMLQLKPPTISHHLSRLAQVGLVSARSESYYNVYRLDTKALESLSKKILSDDTLTAVAADVDMDAYDRKVLEGYLKPDGSLKDLPSQQKKFVVILRYVVRDFDAGEKYTEMEVNEKLSKYFKDTASLRRGLIEFRMMNRSSSGKEYWLVE